MVINSIYLDVVPQEGIYLFIKLCLHVLLNLPLLCQIVTVELCALLEYRIYPGNGKLMIHLDGKPIWLGTSKSLTIQCKKAEKLVWTQAWINPYRSSCHFERIEGSKSHEQGQIWYGTEIKARASVSKSSQAHGRKRKSSLSTRSMAFFSILQFHAFYYVRKFRSKY
jgi:ribosomal protein L24E